jgi:hypothetical protein
MQDEGRIAPALEIPALARVFAVIGDGLFWRRAVDPTFDGATLVPATLQVLAGLLRPVPQAEVSDSKAVTSQSSGDRS